MTVLADASTSALPQGWQYIFGGLGGIVALGVVWRYTRAARWAIKDGIRRVRHAIGVLVGYPELRDPSNEAVLREAIPGIDVRMTKVETIVTETHIELMRSAADSAHRAEAAASYARVDATAAEAEAAAAKKAVGEIRAESRAGYARLAHHIDEVRDHVGLPKIAIPYAHRRETDDAAESHAEERESS